ncbi:MAG TPA: hypothetical protein VL282_04940, partial [Tepidisphaeraceae bacterium]|nr:hypothetical protein [Tepidisphaeraceae bacterium]
MKSFRLISTVALSILLTGCSAMTPGELTKVEPVSTNARAGNVYLLRGFIGIFSTGIDHLGEEINGKGVDAMVFQDDQWNRLAET